MNFLDLSMSSGPKILSNNDPFKKRISSLLGIAVVCLNSAAYAADPELTQNIPVTDEKLYLWVAIITAALEFGVLA